MATPQQPNPSLSEESKKEIETNWNLEVGCNFQGIKFSENHTYIVEEQSKTEGKVARKFILRLTPSSHRSKDAIEAELNYILLVSSVKLATLRVCCPLPLFNKEKYIATITENSQEYFAALFEHAHGYSATKDWIGMTNEGVIESWGKSLGLLHKAVHAQGNAPEKWKGMEKNMPEWYHTHSGAADIKTIEKRAETGHSTSQTLLHIWKNQVEPFLKSCGEKKLENYGVIHGDLNVSNFFVEDQDKSLPQLWLFDFDQAHHNWFGFDLGVVLQGAQFFQDIGLITTGYDPDKFRKIFVEAYEKAYPLLSETGHTTPEMLKGFELFRDFFHTAIAVDILFQSQSGKSFETAIVGFCELCVKRFSSKYESK